MQHEQFSVAWMRLWVPGYQLGLPLARVYWETTVWKKKSNFYWNLRKLYSIQNGCDHVYVPYTTWLSLNLWRRVLSWDSLPIISYVPPSWSIKWKKHWLKASVLYEQLLSRVPYTTLCSICNSMFMLFVYWTIHQLLCSKIDFSLQS